MTVQIRMKENRKSVIFDLARVEDNLECKTISINRDETMKAQLFLCYLVQRPFFDCEYRLLQDNKRLSDKNPLASLNPVIDNYLIKVGGRLVNSLSDTQTKHPIILPHSSTLTTLIVRQAHLRTLHGGTQLTLATLRQQVWILRGRNEVRRIIRACKQCVRYARQIPSQIMGNLPAARVRPTSPFMRTGVDYAGPISVRMTKTRGKGTLKGYICVFVCMATKAVHLELAEDFTADSFIAAFHRFTARRGRCSDLYSEQGTNFVGADAKLKQMLHTSISNHLTMEGTTWHFNPPSAPHFGGLWEAAVKSLKHHLRRVIGEQILTFSEFSTLLCRIEACLNSRPLVKLSDDPPDLEILTPAHFLIQRASYLIPEPEQAELENLPLDKRWRMISQMVHHFWTRWQNEYLTSLQARGKWRKPRPSPKVNDIVLIRNEIVPPGRWLTGKIVNLHPDKEGFVRVVTVKTSTGLLRRPIVKLVLIPSESSY